MKRLLVPFALVCYISAFAQPYQSENLTYLNSDGAPTKEKKAVMVRQVVQLNDTLWETNLYRMDGPRLSSLRSRGADGTVLNGAYVTYRADGWADTLGLFRNGKRDGRWTVFAGKPTVFELQYEEGLLVWKKDSMQLKREQDSVNAANPADSITKVDVQADYPGGTRAWLRYLNHTMRYPDEAVNKNLMGTVGIAILIEKDGSIPPTSLWVQRSVVISLDKEAMRVICLSGNWVPAVHAGRNVKAETLQPIGFRLEVH